MPSRHSGLTGQALPPMRCSKFVEYVLQNHEAPVTIVVCSSREAFLESLQRSLEAESADQASTETGTKSLHPLLIPTIYQLAAANLVEVAYTPTLPHLRAYLASYARGKSSSSGSLTDARPGSHTPKLAIYGLMALHRGTTEFSVQGLSRSLAIAAEAAGSCGMQLILTEDAETFEFQDSESRAEAGTASVRDCWSEQVPVLNSSLALSIDRAWAGRTVDVGAVVAKWCQIVRP
ncbi:MAG: hypothetical protein Q9216_001949 [Gyalolechia sp. 2 TL-2023]